MTDEYVERRRAYVNEIRRSFDRPEVENCTAEEDHSLWFRGFSENPHSASVLLCSHSFC